MFEELGQNKGVVDRFDNFRLALGLLFVVKQGPSQPYRLYLLPFCQTHYHCFAAIPLRFPTRLGGGGIQSYGWWRTNECVCAVVWDNILPSCKASQARYTHVDLLLDVADSCSHFWYHLVPTSQKSRRRSTQDRGCPRSRWMHETTSRCRRRHQRLRGWMDDVHCRLQRRSRFEEVLCWRAVWLWLWLGGLARVYRG